MPKVHEDTPLFVNRMHDVFEDVRAAAKAVFDDNILDDRPQKLFLGLGQVINNVVKPFKRASHDRKISGGKQMASSQDKGQEFAEGELPNGDHRIAEDSEAAFFTKKSKPHFGKLISVIVELSGRYSKVFRDLIGESVGLCSDLNDDSQKARKSVTLHKKTIDFNRFKVKVKIDIPVDRLNTCW